MTEFQLLDLVQCARRELGQRRRVYPRLVLSGKMSQIQADHEIALMEAIRDFLEKADQPELF